jgi:hypothetical protein
MPPTQRELLRLFTPLALSGIFFPLARPIINAALARSENAELALAAFAIAMSVTMPVISPLFGLRQVSTALSSDKDMLRRIRNLTLVLGTLSTVLLLFLSVPQIYVFTVVQIMGIPSEVAKIGAPIFLVFALTPLLSVGRGYYQGILVHYKKAGAIGAGALLYVLGIGATLLLGDLFFNIESGLLAAIASLVGQAFYVLVVALPAIQIIRSQMTERSESIPDKNRTNRYLLFFFVPLAISTVLNSLAEPALQAGMARSSDPTLSLAAYAIAASLGWLARTPLWNAQQLVISHAKDQQGYIATRTFILRLGVISVTLVALLGAPYISDFIFTSLMGVTGDVKVLAISGFRWMLPGIFLQTLRSLYHGVLIRQNLTRQIQNASMVKIPALVLALFLGVGYGQTEGIYIAIWSSMVAEAAEVYWLYRATNRIQWIDR